ncbi:hypothetical protein [Kitasatospora sp. MBT66]|uniref:hypothetical protein n=1 Tax=Kitasatospora sp. MBT66 TaxID=1444769 RepID=UPI0005BCDBE3|nr:hypothetical protein [Kitasatospora sp. MBT66]
MTGPGRLVLIESRAAGHSPRVLAALAAAARGRAVVVLLGGTDHDTAAAITTTGAWLADRPAGPAARVFWAAARATGRLAAAAIRVTRGRRLPRAARRLPHQVTLLARCLAEAAHLATARTVLGDERPAAVVVLTASEALHHSAARLGGLAHLRFVHEVSTGPAGWLRRLDRPGGPAVRVLCPTDGVRVDVAANAPRLAARVRAFAVLGPEAPPGERERETARAVFGIPPDEQAVALVGGWWPHKDIPTVAAALGKVNRPLHLLVAGHPLDAALLGEIQAIGQVRLHLIARRAEEAEIRAVYAAADLAVVARRPGVAKESGLVTDAVRHQVPLLASDHDRALTQALAGSGWARLFTTGDPADLARALDAAHLNPARRPTAADARALGLPTAAQQAEFLTDAYSRLTGDGDLTR